MDNASALKRLDPLSADILSWIYKRIADETRAHGAVPVLIFLPQVREDTGQDEVPEIIRIANNAGFSVFNLAGVYGGEDIVMLRLAEWDEHPNRRGHQLIAERLYDELQKRPGALGIRGRTN
jgi:hypothetical protein